MTNRLARLLEHGRSGDAVFREMLEHLHALAAARAAGPAPVRGGRDGIRYYVHGSKFCEIHPRPKARPPQIGLWLPLPEEPWLRPLRHPRHKWRPCWVSVIRKDQLAHAAGCIEQAALRRPETAALRRRP